MGRDPVIGDAVRKISNAMGKKTHDLVATIICGDEGVESLKATIDSLTFCDLIVISFNGSAENFEKVKTYSNGNIDVFKGIFQNFAWARNTCLERLTETNIDAEWLLWVDSDDICSEKLQKGLKRYIQKVEEQDKDGKIDKIALEVENNHAGETFLQVRLYKPYAKWERCVHEQIISPGETANIVGAKIVHYGYDDPDKVAFKRVRNKDLLLQSLEKIGLNPTDCMALGRMELMDGKPNESLKWLYACLCFDVQKDDLNAANYYLGMAFEALGKTETASELYRESTHPDAKFKLGMLWNDIKLLSQYVLTGPTVNKYGTQYAVFSQIAKEKIFK